MSAPAPDPSPETLGHETGSSNNRGRRSVATVVATAVGVALVGGGAYAAWSFLATGTQPAAALPADTVGYLAFDLDPGGGQKIEAFRTLRKFPALAAELDDAGDDLREVVVDALLAGSACDLTYGDDVAGWMGDRLAVAAVPDGDDLVPVVAVEVTDTGAAENGLGALRGCVDELGWAFLDDFVLLGPTREQARSVAAAADDTALADDPDFQTWTDEAGSGGIMTGYVAPGVGEHLPQALVDLEDALADFTGAGLGARFEDGTLAVSVAAGGIGSGADQGASVGPLVAGLPGTTGLALAFAAADGWAERVLDGLGATGVEGPLGPLGGGGAGLDPADVEALMGDGLALVADGSLDLEAFTDSFDLRALPVGVKIVGDEAEIGAAADRLLRNLGVGALLLGTERGDGVVALGPSRDYLARLVVAGDLGEQERFRAVVPEVGRADGVLFVDLDADWIDSLADDPEVAANLEPLEALGASSWTDPDGVLRARVELSTD
ncbi:MAG: hypothetical protein Q8Q02_03370 [Nocardioides sp.]|nr:hypothetical protein [Nocardioides sp.]